MQKLIIIMGGALFLSLATNLFMAGYMIGHHASGGDTAAVNAPPKPGMAEDRKAEWQKRDEELRKNISAEDRKIFEDIKQQNREKIQGLRKTLEAARDRVEEAEHADPFDRDKLEAAMREEAAAKADLLATVRGMRKEIAGKLSPEGRAAMEKLRPRAGRPGERRGEFIDRRQGGEGFGGGPGGIPGRGPRMQDNGGDNDMPLKSGNRPDFPPDAPPPPQDGQGDGYGNQHPAPPPDKDCGGCEVPGDMPPDAPPQP